MQWLINIVNLPKKIIYIQVEEKLESGQGKTAARQFFSRFCTPIFLEVRLMQSVINIVIYLLLVTSFYLRCTKINEVEICKLYLVESYSKTRTFLCFYKAN